MDCYSLMQNMGKCGKSVWSWASTLHIDWLAVPPPPTPSFHQMVITITITMIDMIMNECKSDCHCRIIISRSRFSFRGWKDLLENATGLCTRLIFCIYRNEVASEITVIARIDIVIFDHHSVAPHEIFIKSIMITQWASSNDHGHYYYDDDDDYDDDHEDDIHFHNS